MLKRKMEDKIRLFMEKQSKALLITGARQTGKTHIIRQYAKDMGKNLVEINFLENKSAVSLMDAASDSKDILLRISALTDVPLEEGKTLIFFDEVQEYPEIVTAIKFLVEDGKYQYLLSGSLLGVELKDIRSVPVGYMDVYEMRQCYQKRIAVDKIIHEKMMELFRLYLMVGGMPEVVNTYIKTNNLKQVDEIQKGIVRLYKKDIAKYDPDHKLYLEEIFSLIPSELNQKNKRFILKNLNENFKFSRYENSFIWLKEAGVALPVYCAAEPTSPLLLSRATNLFKLFASDVGLLASMYSDGLQLRILKGEKDINFGSVYENVVAQELQTHGFELYYYNSKKQGELDFLIEQSGVVLPIEVKSGKGYTRHAALNNVLSTGNYAIPQGIVLCNENVQVVENIVYYPIYMVMFLQKEEEQEEMIYKPDFSALQE